jgi:hypothetical protein
MTDEFDTYRDNLQHVIGVEILASYIGQEAHSPEKVRKALDELQIGYNLEKKTYVQQIGESIVEVGTLDDLRGNFLDKQIMVYIKEEGRSGDTRVLAAQEGIEGEVAASTGEPIGRAEACSNIADSVAAAGSKTFGYESRRAYKTFQKRLSAINEEHRLGLSEEEKTTFANTYFKDVHGYDGEKKGFAKGIGRFLAIYVGRTDATPLKALDYLADKNTKFARAGMLLERDDNFDLSDEPYPNVENQSSLIRAAKKNSGLIPPGIPLISWLFSSTRDTKIWAKGVEGKDVEAGVQYLAIQQKEDQFAFDKCGKKRLIGYLLLGAAAGIGIHNLVHDDQNLLPFIVQQAADEIEKERLQSNLNASNDKLAQLCGDPNLSVAKCTDKIRQGYMLDPNCSKDKPFYDTRKKNKLCVKGTIKIEKQTVPCNSPPSVKQKRCRSGKRRGFGPGGGW